MNKKQDALVPVFGALCFFLSAVEFIIPKPLPFLRIGLANVPLLLALDILSFPAFLVLALIKILGQALISGTLFSYLVLFSAAGTIGAAFTMYLLHGISKKILSLVGISIAGAFVSNTIQLCIGRFFIFGAGVWYMLPPFLCIGAASSLLLGMFCEQFKEESEWYAEIVHSEAAFSIQLPKKTASRPQLFFRLGIGTLLMLFLFFMAGLAIKLVILAAALLLCIAEKQKIHWVPLIISTMGIMVCHALIPMGKELFSIMGFPITSEALQNGLEKAAILQAMIHISRWTVHIPLHIPGLFGKILEESLYIFNRLLEFKNRISPKNLITGLDELLLSIPYLAVQPEEADTI